MSQRDLKLAEQYYEVASDLELRGNHLLQMARNLSGIADQLCEKNIRETPSPKQHTGDQT